MFYSMYMFQMRFIWFCAVEGCFLCRCLGTCPVGSVTPPPFFDVPLGTQDTLPTLWPVPFVSAAEPEFLLGYFF